MFLTIDLIVHCFNNLAGNDFEKSAKEWTREQVRFTTCFNFASNVKNFHCFSVLSNILIANNTLPTIFFQRKAGVVVVVTMKLPVILVGLVMTEKLLLIGNILHMRIMISGSLVSMVLGANKKITHGFLIFFRFSLACTHAITAMATQPCFVNMKRTFLFSLML